MKNPLCSLLGFFVINKKSPQLNRRRRSGLPEGLCRKFSLAELQAATNNFNQDSTIGRGGFGTVYKGTIDNGTIVAVKRLYQATVYKELQNEVQFLCQLQHPHLISLIGFCEERNELILVYEYMYRGDLSSHIYGKIYAPLPWKQRLQICINAARGLHYLHTGAKYAVIHGDIKSRNILLNGDFSGKLDGFGLSKLGSFCMSKASRVRRESRIVGTFGYMAPEYAIHGELTEKCDVYSFGIILFEVLFGRYINYTYSSPTHNHSSLSLLELAEESLREGSIYDAIDPYLKGRISPQCLNKYLEISSSCVHYTANERPAMGEVEVTLEFALELQDRADSEMETINASTECLYEEALFSAFAKKFPGLDSHKISVDGNDLSDYDPNSSNNYDETLIEELMLLEERDNCII